MNWLRASSELEPLTAVETLWDKAVDTFGKAGFGAVIYLSSDATKSRVDVLTNVPELYGELPPEEDPFLEYCCQSYEITRIGIEFAQQYEYLTDEAKAFIQRGADLGYITGFGIPVRLEGAQNFGGFILATAFDVETFEAKYQNQVDALRAYCLLLHRRLEELAGPSQNQIFSTLSPRERDVISRLIEGATRKEIARDLSLSPNTIAEYTQSAYRKLGVRNKIEAARKIVG